MTAPRYRGRDPDIASWAAQIERQIDDLTQRLGRANLRDALQYVQSVESALLPEAPTQGAAMVIVADVGQSPRLLYSQAGQWYNAGAGGSSVYSPPGW